MTWVLWHVKVCTELLPSQRERIALGRQPEANENVFSTHGPTSTSPPAVSSLKMRKCPPTFLFGFSKGGVVLNQLLAEMTHLEDLESRKKPPQRQIRRREASGESAKFGVSLLNPSIWNHSSCLCREISFSTKLVVHVHQCVICSALLKRLITLS